MLWPRERQTLSPEGKQGRKPAQSIWRPYTQMQTTPPIGRVVRATGSYLYLEDGRRILDGISSWWVITHGHCHPRIAEAIARQATQVDQVILADFLHEPAEELAELLLALTPKDLTRVFFSDNGSTAVEVAIKLAFQARCQLGHERKTKILTLAEGYHGDTIGAMSVGANGPFTRAYRGLLFDVARAHHPRHSAASVDDYVADIRRIIEAEHETISALILEPCLQGAGGMIVWPDAAVREIVRLCREHAIYVIFDEVMTGFGRTGAMFAMDRLGVTPDLLCLSKGLTGGTLPLAATLVSDEIFGAFLSGDRGRMFFHGHSFTGNAIACAAAIANIRLFQENETLAQIKTLEETHRESLATLSSSLPIVDRRVCGAVGALEIGTADAGYLSGIGPELRQRALAKGLLLRPLGNVVYLLPPYCTLASDLRAAWAMVDDLLRTL